MDNKSTARRAVQKVWRGVTITELLTQGEVIFSMWRSHILSVANRNVSCEVHNHGET